EKVESLEAVLPDRAIDHHVRSRTNQCQHAADQAGIGQRHHQPPGKHAQPLGHIESYRNEDRDYPGELMTEPRAATASINDTSSRASLVPGMRMRWSLSR